jgi:hypothetical protein
VMADPDARDVTTLLCAWREGDAGARDRLMLVVYDELRRRAAAYLRREQRGPIRSSPPRSSMRRTSASSVRIGRTGRTARNSSAWRRR